MKKEDAEIITAKIIKTLSENKHSVSGDIVAGVIQQIYFQGWKDAVDHCISEAEKYRRKT